MPEAGGAQGAPDAQLLATLLRLLTELTTTTAALTRDVLEEFGLNETSAGVLWMLDPDQPPATMRELARRLGCDPSNITLVSGKLEQAGLTTREVNPDDARARVLTLTGAGHELRARLLDRLRRESPFGVLARDEQHQLAHLLTRLTGSR